MNAIAAGADPDCAGAVFDLWRALLARIAASLREQAAHPARSVVLLPFAQLVPLAASGWAALQPDGFAPRLETTRSWAAREGVFEAGPDDLCFDHGRDLLTAAALLQGAGLAAQRATLAAPLLAQATQLAQVAASLPPALRPDWAERARAALPPAGDGTLGLEGALGRIAVAWAAHSSYASDVLFEPRVARALDALVVVEGLQPDPLMATLAEHYFEKATVLALPAGATRGRIALHACADGEDEAERAAACVLSHLSAGRAPVALVATDRVLQRRINALLAGHGVRPGELLRDETGWRLSTTHAAAQLMAALRAGAPLATCDEVLDWLKLAPVFDAAALRALERRLRRDTVRGWAQAVRLTQAEPLTAHIESLRAPLAGARAVCDWLAATRALLEGCGLWPLLAADDAGQAVIAALGLDDAALADWRDWPAAQRRMPLAEFTRWAADALEGASFRPPHASLAPVVVLPLAQLPGRPFAALVLPGADEQRLPAAPEPPGPWSGAQRAALHLPTREQLMLTQAATWAQALCVPAVDVLWRRGDDSGEPLQPSPLVQALALPGTAVSTVAGDDPREPRRVIATPTARPMPSGAALPAQPLSASSYEMLRACPYRFFALHQLGLQEDSELDVDLDKRDWGNWLHATLRAFHEALKQAPQADREALLDAAAAQTTAQLGLADAPGEFLPFAAAWPALRGAYLRWLAQHEATGAVFDAAEQAVDTTCGELRLKGRIDRIDRLADGTRLLIDYKTEAQDKTRKRVAAGNEDTQLPFYALLSGADAPRAAYLNLAEREPPTPFELLDLPMLAAQLYEGMASDVARIAAGAPLPALGEGSVCDWCAARGLCRKDFWTAP
ncbi:MAG: PD-(D/E)XK nuclease family protein [Comamonadaceae bacterium]|nr:PD-(D/E)XK nuclease family protein [Comamonadaceae bacterium]